MLKKIKNVLNYLLKSILVQLQEEFTVLRVKYYRRSGYDIHSSVYIASNCNIKGKVSIGEGSSLAHNCVLSGGNEGIEIRKNVMIAPNVVIIAFSHGTENNGIPMSKQNNSESKVVIEDDVWVAANCTIGNGVTIGTGSIIAANSFVNRDVEPFSIIGGVPAKLIRKR
ncbi:acyltransferase [Chryseobacterium geocarposphaerae]|uniref:Carbonic anhydrase/acetyltransferase-like protein (Isoleucine patch superfamily) n=1 Tax=Chryseobacterium geocarposphaerae TaxID=1416776 RepID=A0A2M9CAF4_9FLAO|nr:acyltransferase [Chryseobacterium geocarposphaerae]PJJ67829.1 carbonic anhydrase/acetyltransferase-like protein (isoleucine patch superfamily) [Chryseobacterium geocarposphaerae]